jgi:hypothetical protein
MDLKEIGLSTWTGFVWLRTLIRSGLFEFVKNKKTATVRSVTCAGNCFLRSWILLSHWDRDISNVSLLLRIREVPSSNLGSVTGYPD